MNYLQIVPIKLSVNIIEILIPILNKSLKKKNEQKFDIYNYRTTLT